MNFLDVLAAIIGFLATVFMVPFIICGWLWYIIEGGFNTGYNWWKR